MAEKKKKNPVKRTQNKPTKKKVTKKVSKKTTKVVKPKTSKKTVSKKPSIKLEKEKTDVVSKKEVKKEKWYVWLKNNIIENEKEYSKEDKRRRLIVSLFAFFCFLVVLFSTAIIDYTYSSRNNKTPLFVLRARNNYKQVTLYYGLFYKAWKCDNEYDGVNFGRYNSEISYCALVAEYDENDVYTNPNGVKITRDDMNRIRNYYYDEFVNFKNEEELENAIKISDAINKIWWVRKDDATVNEPNAIIGVFGKMESDGWKLQYGNPEYYRCVKKINEINIYSEYNYLDNTCGDSWETLTLDEKICSLAKNKSPEFINNLVIGTGFCK